MVQRRTDAVIVGCVSGKRQGPARAKDLYDSQLFARRQRYAEATGLPWFIFSAKHGVIHPDEVIEWYDVALSHQPMDYRRRIGAKAVDQLERLVGPIAGRTFEIHAGQSYGKALRPGLEQRGAHLVNPVEGLQIGYLYQWYDRVAGGADADMLASIRTTQTGDPAAQARIRKDRRGETLRDLEPLDPTTIPAHSLVIRRITNGPRLVFEDAARFALDFFRMDASSQPGGYDDLAGQGEPDRITRSDIVAINTTMRARSPHGAWDPLLTASSLPWLAALDPSWDLVDLDEATWAAVAKPAVEAALAAATGPGRGLSVGTKVLHLKRPLMFPVLDRLVLEQLGVTDSVPAVRVIEHLRSEGRRNLETLREIQTGLRPAYRRSLVRILDVLLWASHPAAGLSPSLRRWEHVVRPVDKGGPG